MVALGWIDKDGNDDESEYHVESGQANSAPPFTTFLSVRAVLLTLATNVVAILAR